VDDERVSKEEEEISSSAEEKRAVHVLSIVKGDESGCRNKRQKASEYRCKSNAATRTKTAVRLGAHDLLGPRMIMNVPEKGGKERRHL
jgi:hypothetical protein